MEVFSRRFLLGVYLWGRARHDDCLDSRVCIILVFLPYSTSVASLLFYTDNSLLLLLTGFYFRVCAEGEFGTYLGINSFAVSIA